ncbi:MAG: PadR family transcriptional regulator [Candidatus Bathyarchaeota archaeon]|nr:PadR family transcriptional regulator [Candidatus Bathyarchaeota archaeon]
MFPPFELKKILDAEIEKFRKHSATSPQTAMSLDDLGVSVKFRSFLEHFPNRFGVFVEVDNKYYLSEQNLSKMRGQLSSRPFARLLKHTASVPKGLLRVFVFKLLKEKPMSGSEIMDEVEQQTGGQWRPSPGSIYPLLSWLRKNGYAQELPVESAGFKRYMLTDKGVNFLDEHSDFKKLQQKMAPMGSWFFLRMGLRAEGLQGLQEPIVRLFDGLFELRDVLVKDLDEEKLTETEQVLTDISSKIENLTKKLKGDE